MATAPYPLAGPVTPEAAVGEANQLSVFEVPKNVSKAAIIMWMARRRASHKRFLSSTHARPLSLYCKGKSGRMSATKTPAAVESVGGNTETCKEVPMHPQSNTIPFDDELFWMEVDFDGPLPEYYPELGPCWLWQAGKNEWGYGVYAVNRRPKKAHRHAYEMTYGLIPDGLLVCHVCDRPACVNPRHFRLGTNKDNSDDKIRKGRDVFPHASGDEHWTHRNPGQSPIIGTKGEANPGAKLTENDVRAIRRRYAAGDVSQLALATEYGVSQTVIFHLLARNTWQHVEDAPDMPPSQPRVIVPPCGDARWGRKVTADDVRAIRTRYAAGGVSQRVLAASYGISTANVCLIVTRKAWAHLD